MRVEKFEKDLFNLQPFAEQLEQFIKVEKNFVEDSLVISLNARFGYGKTSFLKMWEESLLARDGDKPIVVRLNAWECDYLGDPLFAVVLSLIERFDEEDKPTEGLREAVRGLGRFMISIGNQVARSAVGVDILEAAQYAQDRTERSPNAFSNYEARKQAMEALKSAVKEQVEGEASGVIFLVDELDRCRPDYAISYLETIKHFFDVKGLVFVLAIDRKHLANSAKTAFGQDLNFEEYYRKFVHREVNMPKIKERGYADLARRYVDFYLEKDGVRYCFMELEQTRRKNIVELIAGLTLTPRQIQEIFRTLGHIMATTEDKRGRLLWCIGVGTLLMAALKIEHSDIFNSLADGSLEITDAMAFLNKTVEKGYVEWWFTLLYTGRGLKVARDVGYEDVLRSAGLDEWGSSMAARRELSQYVRGWGDHELPGFAVIREKIEQLSRWG
jgi:hypothetical protein